MLIHSQIHREVYKGKGRIKLHTLSKEEKEWGNPSLTPLALVFFVWICLSSNKTDVPSYERVYIELIKAASGGFDLKKRRSVSVEIFSTMQLPGRMGVCELSENLK